MWEPISLEELYAEIHKTELELKGEFLMLWDLIKIDPEKWEEPVYGKQGGGFWVVAVVGKQCVWYNDIEEGFTISNYTIYGKIDKYTCYQYEINGIMYRLLDSVRRI